MNVTLSLIADFNDIPKEISHILRYVEQELDEAAGNASDISALVVSPQSDKEAVLNHGNEIAALMDNLRLQMAKIDTRMEDCMAILRGYLHYTEDPPEVVQEEPQEVENEEG